MPSFKIIGYLVFEKEDFKVLPYMAIKAKTKALISCAVTPQLICAFNFRICKNRSSQDTAHMAFLLKIMVFKILKKKTLCCM